MLMPVVASMGGIAGSQALTVVIRAAAASNTTLLTIFTTGVGLGAVTKFETMIAPDNEPSTIHKTPNAMLCWRNFTASPTWGRSAARGVGSVCGDAKGFSSISLGLCFD